MSKKNSTNVRIDKAPRSKLAPVLRAVESVSPRWASVLLRKMFFRGPKRRPISVEERAVLARAVRSEVAFGGEKLRTYSWCSDSGRDGVAGPGEVSPRVLLVHGWGGNAAQLTPLVEPLLAAGYRVTAFDGPAHGDSTGSAMTIPMFAEAVRAVAGTDVHAIVSHSMGGASAMLAVVRGLEVKRAVFISPPSDPQLWFARFSEYLQLQPALRLQARQEIEAFVGMRMDELRASVLGPSFGAPLLVIHDENDREVPLADGQVVARSVPGAELVVTRGLGHKRILSDRTVVGRAVAFLGVGRLADVRVAA